jgi:tetratricopeptide (TPR) repeat protein
MESFIESRSTDEPTYGILLHIYAQLLFFSGNLLKLNDLFALTANTPTIGVQLFYAIGLVFQGHTQEAEEILGHILKDETLSEQDDILHLEVLGVDLFIQSIKREYLKVSRKYNGLVDYAQTRNLAVEETGTHLLAIPKIRHAYSLRGSGKVGEAIRLLKACQRDLETYPHRYYQVMTLTRLGHCYHNGGKLNRAIQLYDEGIDLALEIQSWVLLSILYNRVGFVMIQKENSSRAKDYFEKALTYAEMAGATWLTIGPLANLARWKVAQGKINEAIEDYHQFAKVAEGVGDHRELCYAQLGLADLYEKIDDIPKSMYYLGKGVELGVKLGILEIIPQDRDRRSSRQRWSRSKDEEKN